MPRLRPRLEMRPSSRVIAWRGAACNDVIDPEPAPSGPFTVTARPSGPDTVLAEPAQAVVVSLRGPDGGPLAGVVVRFQGLAAAGSPFPSVFTRLPSGAGYVDFVSSPTDVRGQASAQIKLCSVAGTGRLELTVPEFGISDTLEFAILPGKAARIQSAPRDTAILVGRTAQVRARVVDNYDNPRSDPVSHTSFATPATAGSGDAAGLVTGAAPGRIGVVAIAGGLRDTAYVSVVPTGTYAAREAATGALVALDFDGGLSCLCYRPSLSPDVRFVTFHTISHQTSEVAVQVFDLETGTQVGVEVTGRFPEWSPANNGIAFVGNDDGRLQVMNPDGTNRRTISQVDRFYVSQQLAWSPDGAWILARSGSGLDLIEVATGLTLPLGGTAGMMQPAWKP